MTDDNQADTQALPPEEFDVRGCRGAEGIPGHYMDSIVDTRPPAPAMTADKARELLDVAISALQSLMMVEALTLALRSAIQSVVAADAYVAKHMATPAAARVYAVESVDGPLNDAAVRASMFGRHLDDEDVALAKAAAALGYAHGA